MKKLVVTIVIVLSMGMTTFAQEAITGTDEVTESGLFGLGKIFTRNGEDDSGLLLPDAHGGDGDVDADAPLGSGIAVLMGLGAAYALGKKRKED